jgi:hypothetical protein
MENLKLSKINQLYKYKNYKRVDYRDSIFRNHYARFDEKVNGAGNHDRILSNKKDKTYMTFDSQSPFGKQYNELYIA